MKIFKKNKLLAVVGGILISLIGFVAVANAQVGGGISTPSFLKLVGSTVELIDSSYTFHADTADFDSVSMGSVSITANVVGDLNLATGSNIDVLTAGELLIGATTSTEIVIGNPSTTIFLDGEDIIFEEKTVPTVLGFEGKSTDSQVSDFEIEGNDAHQQVGANTFPDGGVVKIMGGNANIGDTAGGQGGGIALMPGKRGQYGDGGVAFYDNKVDQNQLGYITDASQSGNFGFLVGSESFDFEYGFLQTGTFKPSFSITQAANQVNYLSVAGAATGNIPTISALGADTDIDLLIQSKGDSDVIVSSTLQVGTIYSSTSLQLQDGETYSTAATALVMASSTASNTSGMFNAVEITPELNQSGSAGYNVLKINPTETAIAQGGEKNYLWMGNDDNEQFLFTNSGAFAMVGQSNEVERRVQGETTSGATTTTVATIYTDSNSTYSVDITVIGQKSDMSEVAKYRVEYLLKNDNGTLTEVASSTIGLVHEDDAAWDMYGSVNGTDYEFVVEGNTGDDIQWSAEYKSHLIEQF